MTHEGKPMTTRFKDFGTGSLTNNDPLSFKLYDEDFECYPALPGKVLLDFAAMSARNDGESMAETIISFFSKTLKPESYERFSALIDDPNRVVSVDTLGDITSWLIGEYSDRPTEPLEESSGGQ
jgi:hypothetical protein